MRINLNNMALTYWYVVLLCMTSSWSYASIVIHSGKSGLQVSANSSANGETDNQSLTYDYDLIDAYNYDHSIAVDSQLSLCEGLYCGSVRGSASATGNASIVNAGTALDVQMSGGAWMVGAISPGFTLAGHGTYHGSSSYQLDFSFDKPSRFTLQVDLDSHVDESLTTGTLIWLQGGTSQQPTTEYQLTEAMGVYAISGILEPGRYELGASTFCSGLVYHESGKGGRDSTSCNNSYDVRMSIDEVPLPASAWLFLSAIAGLIGARHRKRCYPN